ncbi:hypothetical protein C359_04044, partial [Cryptococcus neoformans Bt120]
TIGTCTKAAISQIFVWARNPRFFSTTLHIANLCPMGILFHRSIRLSSLYRRVRCMDA